MSTPAKNLLIIGILISFTACHYPVRILTDAQIEKHYRDRPVKPEIKYIVYKNLHIRYALVGDSTRPLLLIIHGAPGAWYSAMKLLDNADLQKNFRMIAIDRAGYGRSDYGVSEPSIQTHVEYLEKIVDEYSHNEPIYIMGSSFGAPIAASFAMQHPQRIKELYLVSPVIDPASEKFFWFSYVGRLGFISMFLPGYLNVAGDEKFAHRSQLKALKPHWGEITAKTYVFMGKKDNLASLNNLEFARKHLVNARDPEFYLFENTGHAIIYQRSDFLISLLLKNNQFLVRSAN
jgi:pimeloyl-ACP methyl ester carboxylesterase